MMIKKYLLILTVGVMTGCNAEEQGVSNTLSGGGSAPNAVSPAGIIVDSSTRVQAVTALNVTSLVGTQTNLIATKTCGAGSAMTSGGCECKDSDNGAFAGRIKVSKPSGNGWYCECTNTSGDAANHPVIAHAVCMTPTFSTTLAP